MPEKKPKPRCKNCGDETSFPANCAPERQIKEWCVPCYTYWKKNFVIHRDGTSHWKETFSYAKKTPYDSSNDDPRKDST